MHQIQKLVPLLLLPLFLLTLRPALAAENTGALTIRCAVERNGTTDELAGDRFDLVPVAEGEVEWADGTAGLHCRTVSPFDCDWNRLTAQESRQTAAALADAAGAGSRCGPGTTRRGAGTMPAGGLLLTSPRRRDGDAGAAAGREE